MSYLDQLPADVSNIIQSGFLAEFATVSAAGVPIDTPLVTFTSESLDTIDAGTGLAYPAKAERARQNPKTGLLFEGGDDQPVVSIAGMASIHDSDLQSNLERYLAEEILAPYLNPKLVGYESTTCRAIWYFTRILICVKPKIVRWWRNRDAMNEKPQEWHASSDTIYPPSDRTPPGAPSRAPWRAPSRWEALAETALARKAPGHLTLLDPQGFPLPIRARKVHGDSAGFRLIMPEWLPWTSGKATLSFEGVETFVGNATIVGNEAFLHVERAMPVLPMMADLTEVMHPKPGTKTALMERLDYETKRRGVQLPTMPITPPEPTAGARRRAASADSYGGLSTNKL